MVPEISSCPPLTPPRRDDLCPHLKRTPPRDDALAQEAEHLEDVIDDSGEACLPMSRENPLPLTHSIRRFGFAGFGGGHPAVSHGESTALAGDCGAERSPCSCLPRSAATPARLREGQPTNPLGGGKGPSRSGSRRDCRAAGSTIHRPRPAAGPYGGTVRECGSPGEASTTAGSFGFARASHPIAPSSLLGVQPSLRGPQLPPRCVISSANDVP